MEEDFGVTVRLRVPARMRCKAWAWPLVYRVEQGVLQWFRERGIGPQRLYHEYGVGLAIVDSSALLLTLLEVDDQVVAEIILEKPGRFSVVLRVERKGSDAVVLKSKVAVALVREKGIGTAKPLPDHLAQFVVADLDSTTSGLSRHDLHMGNGDNPRSILIPRGSQSFLWSWVARYFHCHYSDRVQHSAYTRALEEVVDRFLADRGISVRHMLDEFSWIPVVSRVRVQLLADAHMEETIHTTFVVEEILKATLYSARMDCYVGRRDTLVHTATSRILHGYAISQGEGAGRLAELNESTLAVLTPEVCI